MSESITLNQEQLQHYVHVGAEKHDELSSEEARICRQIGLFFATNLDLANYAVDIRELTLSPRGDDEPPLSELCIVRRGSEYRLTSDEQGRVPLPWRMRRRGRRFWRPRS